MPSYLYFRDYIRYILTGVFATEVQCISGMQLLDVPGRCWSDEVLEKLEIPKEWLGTVYESCEVTGTLLPEIAEQTGLECQRLKVVGGAGDNAAAAVGTGVVRDGECFLLLLNIRCSLCPQQQSATIDPKEESIPAAVPFQVPGM